MTRGRILRIETVALSLLGIASCGTASEQKLRDLSRRIESEPPPVLAAAHEGPGVAPAATGTGRFARFVLPVFRGSRAMETVLFADRFYREPGNEGFDAVLDHVRAELEKAGFGHRDPLRLETYESPMSARAWTPRRARVELLVEGAPPRILHQFSQPGDRDRTMLPARAPAGRADGAVALSIEDVREGSVLATDAPLSADLLRRAHERGAAGVVSGALGAVNVDPTGGSRHLDAIQYASVEGDCPLPVAMISPRSLSAIREAAGRKGSRIVLEAEVELADRPLRTLVATVEGSRDPDLAVVLPAHVQEPGACDNASGVATLLEDARVVSELLERGDVEIPLRSIAFVWGQEMEESRVWLERSGRTAIAAVAVDMTGESKKETGAEALLERLPDPGAVVPLLPDAHTGWGSSRVEGASLVPDGIAVVARCALIDVGSLSSGWTTREHPYEGGSDHAVFLEHRIPAVLFWHFPDFAYHTSLDRASHVDREEMRRTGSAILATALALADARSFDMQRYLESLRIEQDLRLLACEKAKDVETAELWKAWCKGARLRLAELCLGSARPESGARRTAPKPEIGSGAVERKPPSPTQENP